MRELLYTSFRIPGASGAHAHGFHLRQQLLIDAFAPLFDRVIGVYWLEFGECHSASVMREATERTAAAFGKEARVYLLPLVDSQPKLSAFDYYVRALWRGPRDQGNWRNTGYAQVARLSSVVGDVRPSAIFAQELSAMSPLARVPRPSAPIFYDVNDILSVRIRRDLAIAPRSPGLPLRWLQMPALRREERRALHAAALSFVCSDTDRDLAEQALGRRVACIPNAVELPTQFVNSAGDELLLFVGSLAYGPNRDAADWMTERIWPHIRTRVPSARFLIAGANPEALRSAGTQGVECLGFVPDLAPVYSKARVVVCPLRSGSGTRLKLLEAAAHARGMVSTTIGAEGIAFRDGVEILLRDDPKAFADACVQLLLQPQRAVELGRQARALIEANYTRAAVIQHARGIIAAELGLAKSPAAASIGS